MGGIPDSDELLGLVNEIYAAATAPELWPSTLQVIADAFGAAAMPLQGQSKREEHVSLAVTYNLDHLVEAYSSYYLALDPSLSYARRHPDIQIIHDNLHTSETRKNSSEYYTWLKREAGLRYCVDLRLEDNANSDTFCSLHFSNVHGHIEEAALPRFVSLRDHLARAVKITCALERESLKYKALDDAIEHLSTAVVILNRRGKVIHANPAAQQVFAADDGLNCAADGLHASSADDTRRLRQAAQACLEPQIDNCAKKTGASLYISRPSRAPAYELLLAPVGHSPYFYRKDHAAVLVLINTGTRQTRVHPEFLQNQFGLTPAETRLCETLLDGVDITEAGKRLGIAANSSRARLSQIMLKTETHRQAELVALLHSLRPGWH